MKNIAVIFAGGVGTRMNSLVPKQFLKFKNKEILLYTIERFNFHDQIDAIAVACLKDYIPYVRKLVQKYRLDKVKWIVEGGATGQLSIFNGINAVYKNIQDEDTVVLINDGVRPLVSRVLISNCIKLAREFGAAVSVVKAVETAAFYNDNQIESVLDRSKILNVKAPQAFKLDILFKIAKHAVEIGDIDNIDTLTLMNKNGIQVKFVETDYNNIKITTNTDFVLFKALQRLEDEK